MLGDRWGVTPEEVRLPYACDALVPTPTLRAWRGVTVRAEPARVWPWVGQIRVAPYSYDWIDNLGRRSPASLLGLPEPRVGEPFTACGGRPLGRIVAVDPGRELTGEILGAVMSYRLRADPAGTRLLLKIVMDAARPVAAAVCLGDLVMARRQLLTLRSRAEQEPTWLPG